MILIHGLQYNRLRTLTLSLLVTGACLFLASPEASANYRCSALFSPSTSLETTIESLDYMAPIPARTLRDYSSKDIARAMVSWVRRNEPKTIDRNQFAEIDLMRESQIVLFFHTRSLSAIASQGFLNMFQTKSTSGGLRKMEEEDRLLGLTLPETGPGLSLRPKSAFLNISAQADISPSHRIALAMEQYGPIGAVMNQAVKARSLWVPLDAMGLGISHSKIKSKSELNKDRGTFMSRRFPKHPVDRVFWPDPPLPHRLNTPEALIYGSLGFGDVDHFVVARREIASALQQFGKPVFLISERETNGRHQMHYDELLIKGTSLPKSLPPTAYEKFYPVRNWFARQVRRFKG